MITAKERVQLLQLLDGKTTAELRTIFSIMKRKYEEVSAAENTVTSRQFRIGDRVVFTSRKHEKVTGRVERVNRKTLSLHWCSDYSHIKQMEV